MVLANGYELTEEDINKTINYLKIHKPEMATPEGAIEYLETMQSEFHRLAHENPELADKLRDSLKPQTDDQA